MGLPGIFLLPREVWMTYGGGSGPFLEQSAGASQGAVQRIFIFEGMVMDVLSWIIANLPALPLVSHHKDRTGPIHPQFLI